MTNDDRWQILKSWLHSIFLEDWLTKTIALFITLILWYGITGNRAPTLRRLGNVRLILQLPSETETVNEPLNKVDITVTGDKTRVSRLSGDDLTAVVDLTTYKSGEFVIQLKPDNVNIELPNGVKLNEIEPSKISVKIEPSKEKSIEVKPVFTGQLPEGFEIYNTVVTPSSVNVRGAASRVNALDNIPTEKIDLNTRTRSFTEKQVTVDLLDPKITVLEALVNVDVEVGEQRIEKTFANIPVRTTSDTKAMPEKAGITLYGARSVLDSLTLDNLFIELDIAPDGAITPRVILPEDLQDKIKVRSIKPSGFSIIK
ncbi:MAG: CdaR family protein [Pyrinomonadaceae bacterium]